MCHIIKPSVPTCIKSLCIKTQTILSWSHPIIVWKNWHHHVNLVNQACMKRKLSDKQTQWPAMRDFPVFLLIIYPNAETLKSKLCGILLSSSLWTEWFCGSDNSMGLSELECRLSNSADPLLHSSIFILLHLW